MTLLPWRVGGLRLNTSLKCVSQNHTPSLSTHPPNTSTPPPHPKATPNLNSHNPKRPKSEKTTPYSRPLYIYIYIYLFIWRKTEQSYHICSVVVIKICFKMGNTSIKQQPSCALTLSARNNISFHGTRHTLHCICICDRFTITTTIYSKHYRTQVEENYWWWHHLSSLRV